MTVKIIGPIDMRDDVSAAIEDMQRHMEKDIDILFDFETDFLIRLLAQDDNTYLDEVKKMAVHHAFSIITNMNALGALIYLYERKHEEKHRKPFESIEENLMKLIGQMDWIDLSTHDERMNEDEREVHCES